METDLDILGDEDGGYCVELRLLADELFVAEPVDGAERETFDAARQLHFGAAVQRPRRVRQPIDEHGRSYSSEINFNSFSISCH